MYRCTNSNECAACNAQVHAHTYRHTHARMSIAHTHIDGGWRDWRKLHWGKCLTHLSTCSMCTDKSSLPAGTDELLFCSLCSTTSLLMSKDDLVCLFCCCCFSCLGEAFHITLKCGAYAHEVTAGRCCLLMSGIRKR